MVCGGRENFGCGAGAVRSEALQFCVIGTFAFSAGV